MGVFCLIIFWLAFNVVNCDYYSAITGLESLLKHEMFLIQNLEEYISAERDKHAYLINYMSFAELEMKRIKSNSLDYFGNPLNAWRTIKRMTRDWRDYEKITFNEKNVGAYKKRLSQHENVQNLTKPVVKDLIGAAQGIARLQRTYNLTTADLANGIIMGKKVSNEMYASDCLALGWSLTDAKDFKNAATWLLEARSRLSKEKLAKKSDGDGSLRLPQENIILESLVPALMQAGNTKLAYQLAKEHLELTPGNRKALNTFDEIEKRMQAARLSLVQPSAGLQNKKQRLTAETLYEQTCRGDLRQTAHEQRKLRCRYESYNVPFCRIAPFKLEELSLDPFVAVYYEAIYDSEIENILEAAASNVVRSKIGGNVTKYLVSDYHRTSKHTWLVYKKYAFLKNLAYRLTDITGLTLETGEALQVANYGIGGHYGPHYDFENPNTDYEGRGNRILTALFYINDVEFGGGTAFPYLKLLVPPVKRSLLVWYNLHKSLEWDYRMKHAGCPVIKGSKWICNEWYHSKGQEFYRPCDLKPDGYKSLKFSDKNMWQN